MASNTAGFWDRFWTDLSERSAKAAWARKPDDNAICEARIIKDVDHLRQLTAFLLAESVVPKSEHAELFSLGELNRLWLHPEGRAVKLEEWNLVEKRYQVITSYLTPELRKKFQLSRMPTSISWLAGLFIIAGLLSLIGGVGIGFFDYGQVWTVGIRFVCYLFWLICLGAVGAVAFISMNALSIQSDATFDLTNQRHLVVRMVLGVLFGVVLSIPFGFRSFLNFCASIVAAATDERQAGAAELGTTEFSLQAALLLLPFILGFSTTLVVLVLNRFVESISTFFGQKRPEEPAPVKK